ncbi:MAG: signal recognition particle-docking protein FtsY [Thermodesulfobacteriota bacterium]|nr:signal recognition particle-docking protein FtsY [Thermodesulfobacteriota bacterium]
MAFNLFRRKKGKKKNQEDLPEAEDYLQEESLSDEEIERILEQEEQEERTEPDIDDETAAADHQPPEEDPDDDDEAPSPALDETTDSVSGKQPTEQGTAPPAEEKSDNDVSPDTQPDGTLAEESGSPDAQSGAADEEIEEVLAEDPEDLSGEEAESDEEDPARRKKGGGLYARLRNGLAKTRQVLTTDVDQLFRSGRPLDEETLDYLEEMLITADVGVKPATELIENLSKSRSAITDADQLREAMKAQILPYIKSNAESAEEPEFDGELSAKPHVIMVVGVNGVGKTTSIGKLAAHYTNAGKKVLIVAADTFRAAAIEQLGIWAERAGADIVKHKDNSDPAAVAFDGMEAALAREIDVVLVDTAGRLHTKVNLMEELKKIRRTIEKKIPDAPHEVLLVLDATTGQNAISQTRIFTEAIGVTGFVLTKLDGTAKGGIVINLCHTFNLPLHFIGVGEQIDDLQVFDPDKFIDALF